MNKVSLLFCYFIVLNLSFCQSNDKISVKEKLLIGKWNAYKKTTVEGADGSEYTLNGKPYSVSLELDFLDSDRVVYDLKVPGEKTNLKYELNGDNLVINKSTTYVIHEITENHMVLKKEGVMGFMIYFDKYK
ncbi:MAG: lipocalin family protein [Bacteroidota bacterium]|mgnify:CR=1 FL=1